MSWLTTTRDDAVHVVPLDDVIVHAFDDDCACGPRVEYPEDDMGGIHGCLCVHHSLDGREFAEAVT